MFIIRLGKLYLESKNKNEIKWCSNIAASKIYKQKIAANKLAESLEAEIIDLSSISKFQIIRRVPFGTKFINHTEIHVDSLQNILERFPAPAIIYLLKDKEWVRL